MSRYNRYEEGSANMRREIMKYMTDELNFSSDDAKYFSK